MEIREANELDLEDIAALYREAGYGAPIRRADTLIVAKLAGNTVGVVRLCTEEELTVLRGMQVKKTFQRQGIGTLLLQACLPYLERGQAFCLPYTHLASFYAAAGFASVSSTDLPDFLARRLASYLDKGQEVLAMRRLAP